MRMPSGGLSPYSLASVNRCEANRPGTSRVARASRLALVSLRRRTRISAIFLATAVEPCTSVKKKMSALAGGLGR